MLRCFIAVTIVFLLSPLPVNGATIFVPDDFPTIQDAIDAALNGDTIIVRAGTYVENLDFVGKAITVESDQGALSTIVDGNGSGSVVLIHNVGSEGAILDGFTITNGNAQIGGGIHCDASWVVTIKNNIITGNHRSGIYCENGSFLRVIDNVISLNGDNVIDHGGGLFCEDSTLFATGNTFTENMARLGGSGCYFSSEQADHSVYFDNNSLTQNLSSSAVAFCARCWNGASATITNNISSANSGGGLLCSCEDGSAGLVCNNVVEENTYFGIGLNCWDDSTITASQNRVSNNGQGGISTNCFWSTLIITNNVITGNTDQSGAGINCRGWSGITIQNNLIAGNTATKWGGGIRCEPSIDEIEIIDNTIENNRAYEYGGGICLHHAFGHLEGNVIRKNTADVGGGGIACLWHGPRIDGNIIAENSTGGWGGGIFLLYEFPIDIRNCMIVNNSAAYGGGIGRLTGEGWGTSLTNNTIMRNTATSLGGGIYCVDSDFKIANTILWSNKVENSSDFSHEMYIGGSSNPSEVKVRYSDIKGGRTWIHVEAGSSLSWGNGMINDAPIMADPAGSDFHLNWDSPCKDAGDSRTIEGSMKDFEGDPRLVGSAVDIGADEFHTHLYHLGRVTPGSVSEFRVAGEPGQPVNLITGTASGAPPLLTQHGWLYVHPITDYWPIGTVPSPSGILILPVTVPTAWTAGEQHSFQAIVGTWGHPGARLTNLHVIPVE